MLKILSLSFRIFFCLVNAFSDQSLLLLDRLTLFAMSREPSIQTEDDFVWRANDVEKSLLHNEMNGPQESDETSCWTRLKRCAVYLATSICFGALLSLAIYAQSQSRAEYGTSSSQDQNWSRIFHVIAREFVMLKYSVQSKIQGYEKLYQARIQKSDSMERLIVPLRTKGRHHPRWMLSGIK